MKKLLAVVGMLIMATACKENYTVEPSYANNTYNSGSKPKSSNTESDSVVKRKIILPIKTQPIEQPVTNPPLEKGKNLPDHQEI
ncbi:hypothetical protein [Spirosoma foliorum]|uniref:Lipoprotein n=1 Tax=Spirosoma foliorum TaxID=2710596 RepID=A0A7G5GQS1_9BACT|nr:hypothetical protein [Spirosoma foliorum]QMW01213.1 hypothetical protein H3H32_25030 [Spirosoma foliorum]